MLHSEKVATTLSNVRVVERERAGVALPQVGRQAERRGPPRRDGEHRRAPLDPGERDAGGVVGEVQTRAERDLEGAAGGPSAHPRPRGGEPPPLDGAHVAVVGARPAVP